MEDFKSSQNNSNVVSRKEKYWNALIARSKLSEEEEDFIYQRLVQTSSAFSE